MTNAVLSPEGGIRLRSETRKPYAATQSVVMKASPASTFIVIEAKFLLEFLIVALDPPAQFGRLHEPRDGCILRQGREPVFGWRVFVLGPFDEQPFFCVGLRAPVIPVGRPDAQAGEAGVERLVDAFTPCDLTPGVGRQRLGGQNEESQP